MEGVYRMEKALKKLLDYGMNNEVLPPETEDGISSFEKDNHIRLPLEFIDLLKAFDGGEILIPGPTIFGIKESELRKTIKEINGNRTRGLFSIPNNYLIVAQLNYGDYICIDLNAPHTVIQWDHEKDELFCKWDNLSDWLEDTVSSFEQYLEGET